MGGGRECFLRNLLRHWLFFFVSFFFSPYTGKKECPFLTFCLGSPFKFKAISFFISSNRENSPATFPDTHSTFQTALFHPTPIHPKSQPGPEVRLYDPNTGKLIRKSSQTSGQSMYIQSPTPPITLPVHGEHSSFRYIKNSYESLNCIFRCCRKFNWLSLLMIITSLSLLQFSVF